MKQTKMPYLVVLILIVIAIIGYSLLVANNLNNARQNQEKFCESDEDCTILYGIEYKDDCTAGCFSKNFKFKTCEDKIFSSFPPEFICKCIDSACKMTEE